MITIVASLAMIGLSVGGMLFGMFMRSRLPEGHLSADTKDIAKVALGLVATISALVLSLLLSTAKTAYDSRGDELIQLSTDILMLDRVLAHYGHEADNSRAQLRAAVTEAIEHVWSSDNAAIGARPYAFQLEGLHDRIARLPPNSEEHQAQRGRALQLLTDINRTRFLLVSRGSSTIPIPFLVVLILWVTVIFTGLGLFAPGNPTAVIIFVICSISAAGAIFLILELDEPFVGIIKVSDAPLQRALAHLGQ
jgi:hypothetical protein